MHARLRRTVRRLGRSCRPAVALLLVLAQAVTALGYPVVGRAGRGGCGGACGCDPAAPSDGCCCGTGQCAVPVKKPDPACGKCGNPAGACCCAADPEPEPAGCPMCRAKTAPAPKPAPVVGWVLGMKARQCHGDGPLGLFADVPAVPPTVPSHHDDSPAPAGFVRPADLLPTTTSSVPLEPPPRRG